MPKTMCDVVVNSYGAGGTENPETGLIGAKETPTTAGKKAKHGADDEGKRRVQERSKVAEGGGTTEAAIGDESGADAQDKKYLRQQAALRAFLQGVSE